MLQLQKWFADVAYNHVKDRMSQKPSADIVHGCLRAARQHEGHVMSHDKYTMTCTECNDSSFLVIVILFKVLFKMQGIGHQKKLA